MLDSAKRPAWALSKQCQFKEQRRDRADMQSDECYCVVSFARAIPTWRLRKRHRSLPESHSEIEPGRMEGETRSYKAKAAPHFVFTKEPSLRGRDSRSKEFLLRKDAAEVSSMMTSLRVSVVLINRRGSQSDGNECPTRYSFKGVNCV